MPHRTLRNTQIEEELVRRDDEDATRDALETPRGALWRPHHQQATAFDGHHLSEDVPPGTIGGPWTSVILGDIAGFDD